MAKFGPQTVAMWREDVAHWMNVNIGSKPEDVITGRDAWTIAHRTGITREAYNDRTVTDGHIQTALEKIFPNAVFREPRVY